MNEYVFKGIEFSVQKTVMNATDDMQAWALRLDSPEADQERMVRTRDSMQKKWQPPPSGWLKCNADGAWSQEGLQCSLGWILRDDIWRVLWIGARTISKTRSALETETEVLRWAIISVSSLGYKRVMFESDVKVLVAAIQGEDERLLIQALCQDICQLLNQFMGFLLDSTQEKVIWWPIELLRRLFLS